MRWIEWLGFVCLVLLGGGALYHWVGPSSLWGARAGIMVLLCSAALVLSPPTCVFLGLVALFGDLYAVGDSLGSLDMLTWAALVGGPAYVANRWQTDVPTPWQGSTDRDSPSATSSPDSEQADADETSRRSRIESMKLDSSLPNHPDPERVDPVEDLQELITRRLEAARNTFDLDNVLVYRQQRREAHLDFLLNATGRIDREQSFRPDVGQGVGWVLAHRSNRIWTGTDIDWRTLGYHQHDVDLARVQMEPLEAEGDFLGVLVLEWAEVTNEPGEALERFRSELARLLTLEQTVKRLQRNQNQLKLMEELHRLNPLELEDYETIFQRALELVGSFIPAEHVEFYRYEEDDETNVLHQGRRQVYERCMEWIHQTGEILRVDDLTNERLGGEPLANTPHLEIRSFLGGAVQAEGELFGMICLDHPEPQYFTVEDERLLRLLLSQLGQALLMEEHVRSIEEEQQYREDMRRMLIDLPDDLDLETQAESLTRELIDRLPIVGAGLYWREKDEFLLLGYQGEGRPSESQPPDHPLVSRLREHPDQSSVGFPELARLEHFEGPVGAQSMETVPVFDRSRNRTLLGFLSLFLEQEEQFRSGFLEGFEAVRPLIRDRLRHVHQRVRLQQEVNRDVRADVMTVEAWRRVLRLAHQEEGIDRITVWTLWIPGYDKIGRSEGLERLDHWMQSIATLLRERFERERMTRTHGASFFGFITGGAESLDETMEDLVEEIESWSFPTGGWPESPQYGFETYVRPFSGVDEMMEGARYQREQRRERERMT